jgi:hypothetical protein
MSVRVERCVRTYLSPRTAEVMVLLKVVCPWSMEYSRYTGPGAGKRVLTYNRSPPRAVHFGAPRLQKSTPQKIARIHFEAFGRQFPTHRSVPKAQLFRHLEKVEMGRPMAQSHSLKKHTVAIERLRDSHQWWRMMVVGREIIN